MARGDGRLIQILPPMLIAALSVMYFVEWRVARAQGEKLALAWSRMLEGIEFRRQEDEERTRSVLRVVSESLKRLERVAAQVFVAQGLVKNGPSSPDSGPLSSEAAPQAISESVEGLPAVPDGIHSEELVRELDLDNFFASKTFNPANIPLSQVDKARAVAIQVSAQGAIESLNSEVHVGLVEGMEAKRKTGDFIEYGPGEACEPVSADMITAGEPTEHGGMRVFFFPAEEHPKIFERRAKMKEVADAAVRRLLSLLEPQVEMAK